MKFSKEFLRDMEGETITDEVTDTSRWSIHHERVFKHEGKFYVTYYSRGATECQEESPYQYENDDEIECPEVEPVEKVTTVYKPVKAAGEKGGE